MGAGQVIQMSLLSKYKEKNGGQEEEARTCECKEEERENENMQKRRRNPQEDDGQRTQGVYNSLSLLHYVPLNENPDESAL